MKIQTKRVNLWNQDFSEFARKAKSLILEIHINEVTMNISNFYNVTRFEKKSNYQSFKKYVYDNFLEAGFPWNTIVEYSIFNQE